MGHRFDILKNRLTLHRALKSYEDDYDDIMEDFYKNERYIKLMSGAVDTLFNETSEQFMKQHGRMPTRPELIAPPNPYWGFYQWKMEPEFEAMLTSDQRNFLFIYEQLMFKRLFLEDQKKVLKELITKFKESMKMNRRRLDQAKFVQARM